MSSKRHTDVTSVPPPNCRFRVGDRVTRVRDTTGFGWNDFAGDPAEVIGFKNNSFNKPLVVCKMLDKDWYGDMETVFYPDELEHLENVVLDDLAKQKVGTQLTVQLGCGFVTGTILRIARLPWRDEYVVLLRLNGGDTVSVTETSGDFFLDRALTPTSEQDPERWDGQS